MEVRQSIPGPLNQLTMGELCDKTSLSYDVVLSQVNLIDDSVDYLLKLKSDSENVTYDNYVSKEL